MARKSRAKQPIDPIDSERYRLWINGVDHGLFEAAEFLAYRKYHIKNNSDESLVAWRARPHEPMFIGEGFHGSYFFKGA